jgi:hypothetical protein
MAVRSRCATGAASRRHGGLASGAASRGHGRYPDTGPARASHPGQVMTRYYGWYASRTRGTRARLASDGRRLTASRSTSPSRSLIRWTGRHHRPGGHHPHPRAPGPEPRTRPALPQSASGPTPLLRPRHGRAASVARSRSAPLPPPDPGPLGAPAARRQSLAARFSPEPGPRRAPNTPDSTKFRPHSPTCCVIDAPPTRPDIRIGTEEIHQRRAS